MLYRNQYIIPIQGLALGNHQYDFHLGEEFVHEFPNDDLHSCDVNLSLLINKTENYFLFEYNLKGKAGIACDRCNEIFEELIDTKNQLILKHASEASDHEEGEIEMCFIENDVTQINIIKDIYDFIMISLPFKKICPEGQCNKEIIKYLDNNNKEDEGKIDPRWEALSKLKK